MTTPAPTGTELPSGTHQFTLPDGRIMTIYVHHCDNCTSIDMFTTRGNEVEEISKDTGDTTRAPMGLMAWANGARPRLDGIAPEEGSHGWPAVSTATLVWKD